MTRRFVLCTTPAQGHTAPHLAAARRLVDEGHDIVFLRPSITGPRSRRPAPASSLSRRTTTPTTLMVANPERESSSKRGVRGVNDDLRRIFIGPVPGQRRSLRAILDGFAADCIVVDTMFLGGRAR
jgi:hypothetical protein